MWPSAPLSMSCRAAAFRTAMPALWHEVSSVTNDRHEQPATFEA